jgi:endonuclease/exonuclease/phosphatase family metal-dependent hydrolase
LLLAVNLIFGFALLVSYLAVHIDPDTFIIPAFFGLAYPYLLLVNIILVITWIALLKYEAFISVIIIALGFTHMSNYLRLGKPSGDTNDSFKVLSYNLRLFNVYEEDNPNSEKQVIDFLKEQNPDILCLQEFYVDGIPDLKDSIIKSVIGEKYYSHMKVLGSGKDKYYGIVTYSKFPIIRKGEIIHPGSSSLSIFSDVLIGKDTFRIFNNQLQSYRLKRMERSFLEEITSQSENEAFDEVKNLSVSLKKGFEIRAVQAQSLKAQINLSQYPVIVAGDFNDTPVSFSYRKIRKGLNDAFVNSGYGAGFTYKGNYPANRIDYILYDNTLESTYFEIFKIRYSDHYPVAAWFRKKN